MSEYRLVYSTWPDAEAAERAARDVVEARLAACANILPGAVSIYRWQDKVMREPECVMLLKTTAEAAPRLVRALVETHPYDTPAVSAIILDGGAIHGPFADWLAESCSPAE